MPQDIPLEASETLAFTPPSLAEIDSPPTFTLRAITHREKRFHLRLMREEGLRTHNTEAIRNEVLRGLRRLWTPEDCEQHIPQITDYWRAVDEFNLQKKDEPDLEFGYDQELAQAIDDLIDKVEQEHRPLRVMLADNADWQDMMPLTIAAVAIANWSNLDVKRKVDRSFLTMDCIDAMRRELGRMARDNGVEDQETPWAELAFACMKRMLLDGEEEKNSASPSPLQTPPESSSENPEGGSSPASASSTKTRKSG